MKLLLNGRWELLISPLQKYINTIKITPLILLKKWINDYQSPFFLSKYLKDGKYNAVHMNSRFDIIFLFKQKNVKYIFESHWFHPWISFSLGWNITENRLKKIIFLFGYPFFKLCFLYNIKRVDLYYVSIPGIAAYLNGKYQARRLPNPIDMELFCKKESSLALWSDQDIKIFYPTGFRKIKNSKFALQLMVKLQEKYKNIKFYIIKTHTHNLKKYHNILSQIEKNIIWLNKVERNQLPNYYNADRDCILGSFYPNKYYAILNMIELEAMACQAPIVCHDMHEIIFEPLDNIFDLIVKLIEDKSFAQAYIQKNYNYVLNTHADNIIAKKYESDLLQLYS